jgi:hypothetical protein
VVKATIYDSKKRLIKSLKTKKLEKGLNYLIWKLDEQAASLNKTKQDVDYKGIEVLPGDYTIVLNYSSGNDTTKVKVIADPRFKLDPKVDQALYIFRKEVDRQVELLGKQLLDLNKKIELVKKITTLTKDQGYKADDSLVISAQKMNLKLKELKAKGKIPRPDRQVGAWQSFETSPHSKLRDVMRIGYTMPPAPPVAPVLFVRIPTADELFKAGGGELFLEQAVIPEFLRGIQNIAFGCCFGLSLKLLCRYVRFGDAIHHTVGPGAARESQFDPLVNAFW